MTRPFGRLSSWTEFFRGSLLGADEMSDTRPMEYGRPLRALCSGIKTPYPSIQHPVGSSQLSAPIETIRPTQITVGFREVEAKRRRYREALVVGGPALPHIAVPVVVGPGPTLFALDRHHWLCALRAEGVYEVAIRLVDDLSGVGLSSFWRLLDDRRWCHPFDVDGRRRGYDVIPETLASLKDDPFRSLASALRRVGGFEKDRTLFSEFQWADYLRRHVDPSRLVDDFEGALVTAVRLARRRAAPPRRSSSAPIGAPASSHDVTWQISLEGDNVVAGRSEGALSGRRG
jgi:hypothetical protein